MNWRAPLLAVWMLAASSCSPPADSETVRPDKVVDFNFLYAKNCAGCHGRDGKGGAAMGLADPLYLAIADDAAIRRVTAGGVPGTAMPAFAQRSGGMLTSDQVDAIVRGIRTHWARPNTLSGDNAPLYSADGPGDPKRGAAVYEVYCSSCHGAGGHGGKQVSSIVDGSFLALVSDQYLRTTVIVGRPELSAPDWRGNVPGNPMSPGEISDVVAWLASQRPDSSALQAAGGTR